MADSHMTKASADDYPTRPFMFLSALDSLHLAPPGSKELKLLEIGNMS